MRRVKLPFIIQQKDGFTCHRHLDNKIDIPVWDFSFSSVSDHKIVKNTHNNLIINSTPNIEINTFDGGIFLRWEGIILLL